MAAKLAAEYTVKLSNGVVMPLVGLGTWQAKDRQELHTALQVALDAGYRYFDTAFAYGNEKDIGEFFADVFKQGKVKREDIFITTKLPFMAHAPKDAEETINQQLKSLQTHIDLYLIHNQCSVQKDPNSGGFLKDEQGNNVFDKTPHLETWKVMEKFYKEGKLRALGISNFRADCIQDLYDKAEIKPHNLQIELHIYHRQRKLVDLCRKLGISITSYATLGSPGRKEGFGPGEYPDADCLNHPLVVELAEKYKRTNGQILLRHAIQQKIGVIPKSVTPARIKQNFDLFDFEISEEDMKRFDEIKEDVRLFSFSFAKGHSCYPPFEA
ncbi:Aldo-ket-red domain-containing protein [Aphelenchoides bicaudatus]|nr:Aldo-ket-red domain-containing protein [Aphelenchoides bicaudatus]